MTSRAFCLSAGLLLWACCGCKNSYDITLKVEGDHLVRALKLRMEMPELPQETGNGHEQRLVSALEDLYKTKSNKVEDTYHLTGRFQGTFTNEVGGMAAIVRHDSPLGSVWSYAERTDKTTNLYGNYNRIRICVDFGTDALLLWLEDNLMNEKDWPKLKAFIDGELREDLQEMSLLAWMSEFATERRREDRESAIVQITLRLLSKKYIEANELPLVVCAVSQANRAEHQEFLRKLLVRLLARKLGHEPSTTTAKELAFLSSLPALEKSLLQFLRAHEGLKTLARGALGKLGVQVDEHTIGTGIQPANLDEFISTIQFLWLFLAQEEGWLTMHSYSIRLSCPGKPVFTNGAWDEKAGQVAWLPDPGPNGVARRFCYAIWTEPNDEQQRNCLGGVVLQGEPLSKYVLWYRGLTDEERTHWDQALNRLSEVKPPDFKKWLRDLDKYEPRLKSFTYLLGIKLIGAALGVGHD